uniref:Uncharacterized protein n=1 Tax=Rhizophora mucronata TaxID=61149 RepID=A0A2P2NFM8_RHIMU
MGFGPLILIAYSRISLKFLSFSSSSHHKITIR